MSNLPKIIFIVLALALTAQSRASPNLMPTTPIGDPLEDLFQYFNGIWGYYNIFQNVYKCFDSDSANYYFQLLQAEYSLAQAMVEANQSGAVEQSSVISNLRTVLATELACYQNNSGVAALINAAGGNASDPNNTLYDSLYGQAHFDDWYLAVNQSFELLDQDSYLLAGWNYAPVLKAKYSNSSAATIAYEEFKAFQNGIWFYMNLTSPYELPNCYNETMAQYAVDFYYYWAQTVNQSTSANVYANTKAYFNSTGGQYLAQVGIINQCLEQTQDQADLTQFLGWDVHSAVFDTEISDFWQNEASAYLETFDNMYQRFLENDWVGAGAWMGSFYYEVAIYANNTNATIYI